MSDYKKLPVASGSSGSSFTAGGDLAGTSSSQQVIKLTGSAGVVSLPTSTSLNLDTGSGTFPATGLIRSKLYAGVQALWEGENAGGDAMIIQQATNSINFGDSGASAGWFTNLLGYTVSVNGRTTATYASPVHTFADFSGSGKSTTAKFYGPIQLDGSSAFAFPTDGYIRVADYTHDGAGIRTIIGAQFGGSGQDAHVLTIDSYNQNITLGDERVTRGSNTFINAYYSMTLQCVAGSFVLSGGNSVQIKNFSNNQLNLTIPTVASGAAALTFGDGITPSINQTISSSGNGVDLTITAQGGKASGNTNGGNLVLNAGAKNSSGANGDIKFGNCNTVAGELLTGVTTAAALVVYVNGTKYNIPLLTAA